MAVDSPPFALVEAEIMGDHRRQPRRSSIRLVREKYVDAADSEVVEGEDGHVPPRFDRLGLLAVEFESGDGRPYRGCAVVERLADGGRWSLTGMSSNTVRPSSQAWSRGGSSRNRRRATLELVVNHADAHSVRLVDPYGAVIEDTIENGVALFLWDGSGIEMKTSTVELRDSAGNVIVSEPYHRQSWEHVEPA